MTNRERRVRTAVLEHALRGRPATVGSLAAATGFGPESISAALESLHEAGALYLCDGTIIAAYPFSLVPTPHLVTVAGGTVYANCAIDALAVPPMTDEPAQVSSSCGHCAAAVTVALQGDRVVDSGPPGLVVFYVDRECCVSGPAVLTRCPQIQFFCGRDHAARWQDEHPELHGAVLDIAGAAAFASRHFDEVIRAVRNPSEI